MFAWILLFIIGLSHRVSTECTSNGRYPNDIVEDCRGYTTCISISNSFYQYDLACPPNFIYNHFDNQCTNATGYHCFSEYNCTNVGTFPNPTSSNCSEYISCIQTLTGISARLVDCPMGSIFSPIAETCVVGNYTCPNATEKPSETLGTQSTVHPDTITPDTKSVSVNNAGYLSTNYVVLFIITNLSYVLLKI